MSDWKDKLPNVSEVFGFTSKLAKDIKKSVSEILVEYKKNREAELNARSSQAQPEAKPTPAPKKVDPAQENPASAENTEKK
jgi:hypothetical protein